MHPFFETDALWPGHSRKFGISVHLLEWHCVSLGVHIDPSWPHVQVHLPWCFVTIGWRDIAPGNKAFQVTSAWRVRDENERYGIWSSPHRLEEARARKNAGAA